LVHCTELNVTARAVVDQVDDAARIDPSAFVARDAKLGVDLLTLLEPGRDDRHEFEIGCDDILAFRECVQRRC
jgi:hypothetical protein